MKTAYFIFSKIKKSTNHSFSRFIMQLATTAVALSISVMVITTSLIAGFQKEIKDKIYGFWAHAHVYPYAFSTTMKDKPTPLFTEFYKHPPAGVKHIQGIATKSCIVKSKTDFEGVLAKGVGNDFNWDAFDQFIVRGRSLSDTALKSKYAILISNRTAQRLKVDTGDYLIANFMGQKIRSRKLTIAGVYNSGFEEYDERYIFTRLSVIQQLNGWSSDSVGGFEVFYNDHRDINTSTVVLSEQILDPSLTVMSIEDFAPTIFDWLKTQTQNERIIIALMIIVAFINMITALLILIVERSNMIGILKALGASYEVLRNIFLMQGAYIIGRGLIIGNLIGILLCVIQKQFKLLKLPADSYYLTEAAIHFNWLSIIMINLVTIIICVAVLLLPVTIIQRISPIKIIQFK